MPSVFPWLIPPPLFGFFQWTHGLLLEESGVSHLGPELETHLGVGMFPWRCRLTSVLMVIGLVVTTGCEPGLPAPPTGPAARLSLPTATPPPATPTPGRATPTLTLPTAARTPTVTPVPTRSPQPTATSTALPSPAATVRPTITAPLVAHVLIVSIDGLRPDVLLQADAPHLHRLWRTGAYSWQARTVVPSVTLVAHASMLSGVPPAAHGIDWNAWLPKRGTIRVPTVFSIAYEAGFSTAMVVGKPKLAHLQTPGGVDYFAFAGYTDAAVARRAAQVIQERTLHVLFVHFPDVDGAGHRWGWGSEMQVQTVAATDAAFGQVLEALETAGIRDRTLIIVTADHGGHGTTHGSDRVDDVTIPWIVHGPGVRAGHAIRRAVWIGDTAATALYALGLEVPANWQGRPIGEAFTMETRGLLELLPLPRASPTLGGLTPVARPCDGLRAGASAIQPGAGAGG